MEALTVKALALDKGVACIVGPEGSGKTTLLEDLSPHLQMASRQLHPFNLTEESSRFERLTAMKEIGRLGEQDICLLDGGEILPWPAWIWLRQRARKRHFLIIATLHKSRGFPVLYQTSISWEVTRELVLELAREHLTPSLEAAAREALAGNSGNVREVFRVCYRKLMDPATSRSS